MGSRAVWSLVFLGGAWEARKLFSPFSPGSSASPPSFFPKLFLAPAAEMPVGLQEPSGQSSRKKVKIKHLPVCPRAARPLGSGAAPASCHGEAIDPSLSEKIRLERASFFLSGSFVAVLWGRIENTVVDMPLCPLRSSCFFAMTSVVLGVRIYL